jgi:hypothetical protein
VAISESCSFRPFLGATFHTGTHLGGGRHHHVVEPHGAVVVSEHAVEVQRRDGLVAVQVGAALLPPVRALVERDLLGGASVPPVRKLGVRVCQADSSVASKTKELKQRYGAEGVKNRPSQFWKEPSHASGSSFQATLQTQGAKLGLEVSEGWASPSSRRLLMALLKTETLRPGSIKSTLCGLEWGGYRERPLVRVVDEVDVHVQRYGPPGCIKSTLCGLEWGGYRERPLVRVVDEVDVHVQRYGPPGCIESTLCGLEWGGYRERPLVRVVDEVNVHVQRYGPPGCIESTLCGLEWGGYRERPLVRVVDEVDVHVQRVVRRVGAAHPLRRAGEILPLPVFPFR